MFQKQQVTKPVLLSLCAAISTQLMAQDDPDYLSHPSLTPMTVQGSTLHAFGAEAHPLASNIIVKYKASEKSASAAEATNKTAQLSKALGVPLSFKRMMSGDAEVLTVHLKQQATTADLQKVVDEISQRDDVEYAEIDAWMVAYRTPNDSRYNEQWHYSNSVGGMKLPGAWDETTGSTAVTVAVLDTGYRPHPDLVGNVVGEYDMISSTSVANDGNGRDSNAQDPGDWVTENQCGDNPAQDSSWHGTHVAGTVAAVSDNNSGVAGVAWNVNLVPVRVLGTCGGSLSDIADGVRWAAGLSVSGVPNNPNPADVINMSLGSTVPSPCSSTYASAINAAVSAGATVVVAAGNDNSSDGYPPGNCANVISVAAGARDGSRAYYSNFGSAIDITAPGGDLCDPITDAAPTSASDCRGGTVRTTDMILSTYNTGTTSPGSNSYDWSQGTSMAAPHVAGLAALIKSVDGTLTPAEVEQVIKDTADSFANVSDHQCTTSICGAGYANAAAAIASLDTDPPPPGDTELTNGVAVTGLSGADGSERRFTLAVPAGATDLSFSISGGSGDADLYVRYGAEPTLSVRDCRPWLTGNNETCDITNVQAGTYHVMIHGYDPYSGVSLVGSYTAGSSEQDFFQNTSNVNIPDNNATGITSSINVNRSGNAGTVEVSFAIVHTWRGDLEVDLIAPNGATATLHSRTNSNDSADNLSKTTTINAASVSASGEWRLRVKDRAAQDTGYIDSWSIEFQ
ncbi:S8 family serine peptidase [Marinicella meishanensis]|uniref:S8 family serine peptidase n=1 Tax=Marinicella meishanensis TaxID=2873263 RepID=UPI001CC051FB|nr:S8 family serine peptidase [Marinicella sp. NBU2979]